MTEAQYLDATNLCKLRMAEHVLRDCLFMDAKEKAKYIEALKPVMELIHRLEEKVQCTEEDEAPA